MVQHVHPPHMGRGDYHARSGVCATAQLYDHETMERRQEPPPRRVSTSACRRWLSAEVRRREGFGCAEAEDGLPITWAGDGCMRGVVIGGQTTGATTQNDDTIHLALPDAGQKTDISANTRRESGDTTILGQTGRTLSYGSRQGRIGLDQWISHAAKDGGTAQCFTVV